jgi:hypothetical protein
MRARCTLFPSPPLIDAPSLLSGASWIAALLSELAANNGPAAANRTRASLSAYCTWLAREGFLDSNPVSFTDKAHEIGAATAS